MPAYISPLLRPQLTARHRLATHDAFRSRGKREIEHSSKGLERESSLVAERDPSVLVRRPAAAMAWRDSYLDVVLIPLAVLFPAVYHLWLWRAVRRSPLSSTVGISAAARRLWVFSMMKNNEKQAILVVQSVRNVLMGSTLVATTSILFCTGVAAVLSSTYAVKKPLSDAVFGAHGEYMMALKYVAILTVFLLAFLCHSLAICTLNQASFLVNSLSPSPALHGLPLITKDYVADVMERGFMLSLAGNRLFFAGAPLLLWIFGPVLPCICSMAMLPILYNMDVVEYVKEGGGNGEANAKVEMVDTESDQSTEV
ncbi:unnamed protein product [Urochloa decumbens]|uniref:DUF599 domain-containing protein n=2 Tax=Urochloa decumbens TaxID=240449 RepID=A0ABC9BGL8_9POAL